MNNINKSLIDLIGNTPLIELSNYKKLLNIESNIIAKLEYFNPLGSVKDRIAYSMIQDAESKGLISDNTKIIEPTSGNTGIGLAFICAIKSYKLILTMPDTMSLERRSLLEAFGAELVLTPGEKGMKGAIAKALELKSTIQNSIILRQFDNIANPRIHRETTAQEIIKDCDGKIDIFVSGVGTGGTITGVGEVLKAFNPDIKIIAVEPEESPVLSGGTPSPHKIQGIGAGFVPSILNVDVIDEIIKVSSADAKETTKKIAKCEGLLVGISSGAALTAATRIAQEYPNKNIVVILPDGGERYLSTSLFDK